MPTTKTIKPAGGGDYTSLASWWTFASGEATADQWAECYDGGDLGEVNLTGATATPSAGAYFRIYAADGEKHDGTTTATGAYININSTAHGIQVQENYTRIEGIRFTANAVKDGVYINGASDVLVDSCNFVAEGSGGFQNGVNAEYIEIDGNFTARNNVMYGLNKGAGGGPGEYGGITCAAMTFSGTIDVTANIYNNTIHDVAATSQGMGRGINCIEVQLGGSCTLNAVVKNNIVTDSDAVDYYASISNGSYTTGGYNTASDATGTLYGSTGSQNSESASNIYQNTSSDLQLLTTAEAYDGGDSIGSFTNSILDITRPEGSAWDKGAFEAVQTYQPANIIVI